MSDGPFAYTPSTYPAPHPVVGIDVTVLVSREVTGGHEITLQSGDVGAGPPPHRHPWAESFFVVKGAVDFTIGGETTRALPGAFFHLPAGTSEARRRRQAGRDPESLRCGRAHRLKPRGELRS